MHKHFMIAALNQAYLGRGLCAPNPSVGAVIVHNNKIISAAWHQGVGRAHAEYAAIQQLLTCLPDSAQRAATTLYVTLEPCNHWGRTPPCVTAIINAGIRQVVYGFRDPNPLVAINNTPKLLFEQGIDVLHLPLPEIDAFYQSYGYWTQHKRPFVTAKIAHSLDGKIAGVNGTRWHLSNEQCGVFTHQQRLATDIILTSARTIINDNPSFNARLNGQITSKTIAIVDTKLTLPPDTALLSSAQHCHIYHDQAHKVSTPHPNCSYHAIPTNHGGLDLQALLQHLGQLGKHDVWVEAGGRLFSALHQQRLVQKTYLYLVPIILGENALPAYWEPNFFVHPHTISWQPQTNNMIACLDWQEDVCSQA